MKYEEFKKLFRKHLINQYGFEKNKNMFYKEFPEFFLLIIFEKSLYGSYYKIMYNYVFKKNYNGNMNNMPNIFENYVIMGWPDLQFPQDIFSKDAIEKNNEFTLTEMLNNNFELFLQKLNVEGLKFIKEKAKCDKIINIFKPEAIKLLKHI